MEEKLFLWDVYEISSKFESLNGVMLRGRIRKLGIQNGFNVLAENSSDYENGVRFAVLNDDGFDKVSNYLKQIIRDVEIKKVLEKCPNPVLSKMQVNLEERYSL